MQAVAHPVSSLDLLANVHHGPRHRSTSDAFPPPHKGPAPTSQLPKAASYTYFPRVKDLEDPSILALKARISEDDIELRQDSGHATPYSSSDGSSPESEDGSAAEQIPQMKPSTSRRSSRLFSFSSRNRDQSQESPRRSRPDTRNDTASAASKSPVRSLSKLRRRSWVSSQSRSNSPTKTKEALSKVEESTTSGGPAELPKRTSLTGPLSIPDQAGSTGVAPTDTPELSSNPKGRLLTKRTKRPLSGLFSSTSTNQQPPPPAPDVPAVPQIPTSFSTEKLPYFPPTATTPTTPTKHIPPLPRNISVEKLKGARTEPRKKDELWTVFRTLEADYRKFQSKSTALKANVVRTTLLPFLRSYAAHPSNHKLRPEDLDRRANILNGWWTALLELLAGRNNQSVSGTDRPAILEGISGIMERPEWRMSPSPFCALADRSETSSTTTMESGGSNTSLGSDFLAESVYHNVRNIFTQNLLSQMSFVVEKMSLRNAAASLVTFCGKTCAYAFCFCPGIADVLVRLWNPSLNLMKRVLVESGVVRQDQLGAISARIVPSFPPTLHSLRVESLVKTVRLLRQPASPPLGAANLDWYGAWMKRWSGAESDLFFVFVKHYHILVADFLPVEPSSAERMCVPGLIMVHAQILANLDATINRHATPQVEESTMGPSSITFDDVLSDPDASASTLPIPPANITRHMAENRLIMLIRDFLSDRNAHLSTARRVFAESFVCLLRAAAKKVSIYDNNACYTLCDFLEEAFVILVRYEQSDPSRHSVLDWEFWLSVCKNMTASHNTATEIKLYAFLYSTWSLVTADEKRKASLCLDFLLEPDFFESRFNHWCPMVRSYYMRLLCWRVARFDGDESVIETNILKALSDRLRSVWAHYLWLREEAELHDTTLPSTQACNPAPGRRFLIIRNDNPVVTNGGPFVSFDGVVQNPNSRRLSTAMPEPVSRPASAQSEDSDFAEEEAPKGRWSLLRSFIGASKQAAKPKGTASSRTESTTKGLGALSGSARDQSPTGKAASREASPAPVPTHRAFSFRFSLEWVDKRFAAYQHMRLSPPRLPLPAQAHLQNKGINTAAVQSARPTGAAVASSRYAGRALAEWTLIFLECQNFFDRRKNEGVPSDRYVETPTLAVEAFRRPG